jgi:flavin-dependent dehydrogenase
MTDVLIKGDGPAGLAAAITLAQLGKAVTVVQRNAKKKFLLQGESLSASASFSLKEINVFDEFMASDHRPCQGNCSSWGSNKLFYFDFIQSPLGSGWYVDRAVFEEMLRRNASAAGVKFITSERTDNVRKNADNLWLYQTDGVTKSITAKIIIDASGRAGWLSRQLGIHREGADDQIALITVLECERKNSSYLSLIESVHDGWWYIADFANKKTIRIFFTDATLHKSADLFDPGYLRFKQEQTLFVKHRLSDGYYEEKLPAEITEAGSHHLSQFSGAGWLAAGDAACALDPVSSFGIAFAVRSGIDAGLAANSSLCDSTEAVKEYNQRLRSAVLIYQQQRTKIYQMENRWPASPFWQRRRNEGMIDIKKTSH